MSELSAYVRDLIALSMAGRRPPSHAQHDRMTPGCLACTLTALAKQLTPQTQEALAADQTGGRATAPTTERTPGP